ncbi:uncharacterized protein LOC133203980 [Saccostrea echinata]|uniref:uncharacterized protein LOC133203980 n=1 Tax=Saccostrea echinata TaxID=191078 RepID=UPI002A7FE519|nr:uncharacterized protein LOC133203980 [Saccostrea echinata]
MEKEDNNFFPLDLEPNTRQDPLSLKSVKKLQNHGIQAESGTPSNFVRTESSPMEYLKEQMLDNQHGNLEVSVRGNETEHFLPCTVYTELKKTYNKTIGYSICGVGPSSVKPNPPGPARTRKVPPDLEIRKFVQGFREFLSKEHGKVHICCIIFKNLMAATVMCTKFFETKWGFKTFGFLMFLLFSMAASSGAIDECTIAAVKTIKTVQKCPTNRLDWDTAANLMNCSALVPSQCTTLKYHCVVNGFGNATIEVCADPRYIQPGYCPEFNERGRQVQNRQNFSLKEIKIVYNSTDVYKYPLCFEIVTNTTKPPSPATMSITKPSQTTVSEAQTTPGRTNWRNKDSNSSNASVRNVGSITGILLGTLLPVVVICCICTIIYWLNRRKGGQWNSTDFSAHPGKNEQKRLLRAADENGVENSNEGGTATHTQNDGVVGEKPDMELLNGHPC